MKIIGDHQTNSLCFCVKSAGNLQQKHIGLKEGLFLCWIISTYVEDKVFHPSVSRESIGEV